MKKVKANIKSLQAKGLFFKQHIEEWKKSEPFHSFCIQMKSLELYCEKIDRHIKCFMRFRPKISKCFSNVFFMNSKKANCEVPQASHDQLRQVHGFVNLF